VTGPEAALRRAWQGSGPAAGLLLWPLSLLAGLYLFSFQIYADFSGYSDIARGLARMLGFNLMVNFNQPYFSASITEFWRRWHISLSTWLRDYLYIPLGGNRRGRPRRYANVLITMLLGGLWHGAGWTFVFWGLLHGGYVIVNRIWLVVAPIELPRPIARALTFLAVVVGWVFFRAENFETAVLVLEGMIGMSGVAAEIAAEPEPTTLSRWLVPLGLAIAFLLPNSQQLMGIEGPEHDAGDTPKPPSILGRSMRWKPSAAWAAVMAGLAVLCVWTLLDQSKVQEFIYFQF